MSSFSVETLVDALLVLYDECCSSNFKREKTVVEFVESGRFNLVVPRHYSITGWVSLYLVCCVISPLECV